MIKTNYTVANWGVVIVTYNPDVKQLEEKIEQLVKCSENIIIVNNGHSLELFQFPQSQVINLDKNMGIAYAQNLGAKFLRDKSIEKIFFLDQDSDISEEFFYQMLLTWDEVQQIDSHLGMLSPRVIDKNFKTTQKLTILNSSGMNQSVFTGKHSIIKDTFPISSGILVATDVYFAVGGETSELFIDFVDYDLNLKLKSSGYNIYSTNNAAIYHSIGKKTVRNFFGKKIYPTNHAIFRDYYFVRNAIYLSRKYGNSFIGLRPWIYRALLIKVLYVFYESKKLQRFHALFQGLFAGMKMSLDQS